MDKIKRFDNHAQATLSNLRGELTTVLSELGNKLGIRIELGTMRYDSLECRATLTMFAPGDGEVAESAEVRDFKRYAPHYGYDPSALGSKLYYMGKEYTVVGLKPKSHKYPLIVQSTGTKKKFKLPMSALMRGLKERVT